MPRKGENIRKRSDGRWEGRYCTVNGSTGKKQYHSVYARTYKNVKEKLITIKQAQLEETDLAYSKASADTSETFGSVAGLWLQNVQEHCKYSTYVKYRQIYEKHIEDTLGGMEMMRINSEVIRNMREGGVLCADGGRRLTGYPAREKSLGRSGCSAGEKSLGRKE